MHEYLLYKRHHKYQRLYDMRGAGGIIHLGKVKTSLQIIFIINKFLDS